MPQIQEKSVDKCDSDASAVECDQNDENNSTNTLTFVKKRLKSFTIRRKVKIDDKIDMSQCTDSDEPSGKSKITIRKIFRKSSIRKFINNLQNFTNFTVSLGLLDTPQKTHIIVRSFYSNVVQSSRRWRTQYSTHESARPAHS